MLPLKNGYLCNHISITHMYHTHIWFFPTVFSFYKSDVISNSLDNIGWWSLPLTVRCTQLPLWKVSYCCSSISTLHSYQPWSSERTFSIRREDLPCSVARPGQTRRRCGVSSKVNTEVRRTDGLNLMRGRKTQVRGERTKRREKRNTRWMLKREPTFEQFRYKYARITKRTVVC